MNTHFKLFQLTRLLIIRTEKNIQKWDIEVNKTDIYYTSVGTSFISISQKINPEASYNENEEIYDYSIRVYDKDGNTFEEFDDVQLVANMKHEGSFAQLGDISVFREMKALYDMARRSALGSDEVIDSLLKELGSTNN